MDILIVKLGALGDVINTLPLAINLKTHFNARIHWLVEPLSYPLISGHRYIDHCILFDKYRWRIALNNVLEQIRKIRFDITLDLQRILKSSFFCLAAKTHRRVGFDRNRCKEMTWIFPFERIPPADPQAHMLNQYLEFASYLGIPSCTVRWEIPLTADSHFDLPPDYVVLNIGASKPANRWVPEGFAQLAQSIKTQHHIDCVLTGGPEDVNMAERITEIASRQVINLVGQTSLSELVEVLHGCRVVVSSDTGPMHLAVALGKNVVALFGPANPQRTGPFRGKVISKNLHCSPCNLKECRDPVCMHAITPQDVLIQVELFLSNRVISQPQR